MARIAAVITGLARAVWREQQSLGSVAGNNFFLAVAVMIPGAGVFLLAVIGLLLLLPLCSDPMRKIPKERLALWPFRASELAAIRFASVWLSPVMWLILVLLFWASARFRTLGWEILAVLIATNLLNAVGGALIERRPALNVFHWIPPMPGMLGELVQKNLREMLSTLDPYLAMVVSAATLAYRVFSPQPQPEAFFMMSMMVVLALSTYAQNLFALDAGAPFLRYRLLPLRGWQVLLAKDVAFLMASLILAAPLRILAALAAALSVLAVGHHASVAHRQRQPRWRFTGGMVVPHGLVQVLVLFGSGALVECVHEAWILAIALGWLASLTWYGRRLEDHS